MFGSDTSDHLSEITFELTSIRKSLDKLVDLMAQKVEDDIIVE